MEMIKVEGLGKVYGDTPALEDVSFSVQSGEVIGLLGPNGAGKTTLMKILTGYLHPTSGTATIGGFDVLSQTDQVQKLVGYLPENAPLYPELTVQSYLGMMADLRGIGAADQREMISEAIHAVGLEDRLTRPIGTLSKGYRQRVGLAQAILHRPRLLILDEPTNGLDPTQITQVRKLIRKLADQATILLSTHILSEVEATCDRAIIIMFGRLRADARLADLAGSSTALISFTGEVEAEPLLRDVPGVVKVSRERHDGRTTYAVTTETGEDICPKLFRLAAERKWPVAELRRDVRNLEHVFNELAAEGGLR